jgi:anti-sigma regulatory factor (Ser/Thr protein kinase)
MRVLKKEKRSSLWVRAEMENLHHISRFVKDWLAMHEEYEKNPEQSYLVELAVIEACTNVIRHAALPRSADSLGVSMKRAGEAVEILILDRGAPFDPTRSETPDLDQPREGGYGIHLIQTIMRGVRYQRRGSRWNTLHLTHTVRTASQGPGNGTGRSVRSDAGCGQGTPRTDRDRPLCAGTGKRGLSSGDRGSGARAPRRGPGRGSRTTENG